MLSNDPTKLCAQIAHVLLKLEAKYGYSEEFKNLRPKEPFFEESCAFVGLRYEIRALADVLRAQDILERYLKDFEADYE